MSEDTWICICHFKDPEKAGLDLEPLNKEMEPIRGQEAKVSIMLPASAKPECNVMYTKKGFELGIEWAKQQDLRSQKSNRMFILANWDGYGISEVIENTVCSTISF